MSLLLELIVQSFYKYAFSRGGDVGKNTEK